jgi:signal transduction histidine kinase
MPVTLNEKLIAYLTLISGLAISVVAEYYSIIGFTAIFAAAVIPVIIMGIVLGVGKIAATLWLKQNWSIAPWSVRIYLLTAIAVLMGVTSMGIFGFLSQAHSDQSLVSGDVMAKIAVYDEKIKTAKENIDANRKALKQMDEAVDQVMGRSQDEKGADKAVGLRRAQQKERARLQSEISAEQKTIAGLTEERAPIAADVRKVEAEVGPIKYIAAFVYGETSEGILEKAVTWVIILLIVVFDPMAVILLLSSQISFQDFRKRIAEGDSPSGPVVDVVSPEPTVTNLDDVEPAHNGFVAQEVADVIPEAVTGIEEETVTVSVDEINNLLAQARQELEEQRQREIEEELERDRLVEVAKTYIPEKSILEQHPYLLQPFRYFKNLQPIVYKPELERMNDRLAVAPEQNSSTTESEDYLDEPLFVQNEEQKDSSLWTSTLISKEEYLEASASAAPDLYNDAPQPEVAEYIALVKSGKLSLQSIPEEYMLAVKAII